MESWKMICDICSKNSTIVAILYVIMINIYIYIVNEGISIFSYFSGSIDSWYKGIGIHNITDFFPWVDTYHV